MEHCPSKKIVSIALALLGFILVFSATSEAVSWERVVEKGFGDPFNDYAWSMEVFQGSIYVGTFNIFKGAQIWRSGSGEAGTWEQIYKDFIRGNMGIRSLYNDNDEALYAGTLNRKGAQLLRTTDGRKWETVIRRGLWNKRNTTIRCITRFGEYLYAGAGSCGAKLFRSEDGQKWEKVKTEPSFDSTKVRDPGKRRWITNNISIGELAVFNDMLYAFTWTMDIVPGMSRNIMNFKAVFDPNQHYFLPTPGAFEIWRTPDGINWEIVAGQGDLYENGMGFSNHDSKNLHNDAVTSVAVFDEHLYVGTENSHNEASIWRSNDGLQWGKVLDFSEFGEGFNYYVWRMTPFQNKLYVGTMNVASSDQELTGAQILESATGDPGSFSYLIRNGFDAETTIIYKRVQPKNMGVRSFVIFENKLFAGTATPITSVVRKSNRSFGLTIAGKDIGCEIWKMRP